MPVILFGRDVTKAFYGQVSISPVDAKRSLELNLGNRRIRPMLVEYLAKCIVNGEWQEDHPQPIVFSDAGRMIDGQHRMLAIVKAKTQVVASCVFGARDGLREYIDTGISRTLDDRVTLHEDHIVNKHCCRLVNAILWMESGAVTRVTPSQTYDVFMLRKEGIVFTATKFLNQHKTGITTTPVGAAFVRMYEIDKFKACKFASSLLSPDGDVQPARMLQHFLLSNKISGRSSGARLCYGKAISAMKAYLEDREVKVLRASEWD